MKQTGIRTEWDRESRWEEEALEEMGCPSRYLWYSADFLQTTWIWGNGPAIDCRDGFGPVGEEGRYVFHGSLALQGGSARNGVQRKTCIVEERLNALATLRHQLLEVLGHERCLIDSYAHGFREPERSGLEKPIWMKFLWLCWKFHLYLDFQAMFHISSLLTKHSTPPSMISPLIPREANSEQRFFSKLGVTATNSLYLEAALICRSGPRKSKICHKVLVQNGKKKRNDEWSGS